MPIEASSYLKQLAEEIQTFPSSLRRFNRVAEDLLGEANKISLDFPSSTKEAEDTLKKIQNCWDNFASLSDFSEPHSQLNELKNKLQRIRYQTSQQHNADKILKALVILQLSSFEDIINIEFEKFKAERNALRFQILEKLSVKTRDITQDFPVLSHQDVIPKKALESINIVILSSEEKPVSKILTLFKNSVIPATLLGVGSLGFGIAPTDEIRLAFQFAGQLIETSGKYLGKAVSMAGSSSAGFVEATSNTMRKNSRLQNTILYLGVLSASSKLIEYGAQKVNSSTPPLYILIPGATLTGLGFYKASFLHGPFKKMGNAFLSIPGVQKHTAILSCFMLAQYWLNKSNLIPPIVSKTTAKVGSYLTSWIPTFWKAKSEPENETTKKEAQASDKNPRIGFNAHVVPADGADGKIIREPPDFSHLEGDLHLLSTT